LNSSHDTEQNTKGPLSTGRAAAFPIWRFCQDGGIDLDPHHHQWQSNQVVARPVMSQVIEPLGFKCSFLARSAWYVQFLESDLKTPPPRTFTFADPEKIRELARRSEAWGTSEARYWSMRLRWGEVEFTSS